MLSFQYPDGKKYAFGRDCLPLGPLGLRISPRRVSLREVRNPLFRYVYFRFFAAGFFRFGFRLTGFLFLGGILIDIAVNNAHL